MGRGRPAWAAGIVPVAIAVVLVIFLNAGFAFAQEMQAERAVEPSPSSSRRTTVLRDGRPAVIDAAQLVPGDVLVIEEGDRICADARLLSAASRATSRRSPASRCHVPQRRALAARRLAASGERHRLLGTTCTAGDAHAVVFATGMSTELGRIAALSERVETDESPLETQVRRVAWLIAAIAVATGIAFIPSRRSARASRSPTPSSSPSACWSATCPEGLLPVITLALAVGVRDLARRGAVVKRLSAVETLGSTDVICTDKTAP